LSRFNKKRNIVTTETEIKINREHKDRLFRLIFGREENKKNLLELYNALNDTHYSELDDLKLTTIDDVIYMGMKNDVSLLIHSRMALFEHQSTYNPNMPIRGMMYAARLYDKHIEENKLNIYSTDLMKLPTPQYIVFYNGNEKHEDEEILRLSDAFEAEEKTSGYEWTARMLNINYGRNQKLMEKCKPLRDYAILIDKIKRYIAQKKSIKGAVNQAVDECIKEDVLADFLRKHRAEVMDVCITEYNEERVLDAIREEGYAEGREEGIKNVIQTVLDFGGDIQTAVTKASERYKEDEKKIWDVWERRDK
jgi:predicted transposase YdaD